MITAVLRLLIATKKVIQEHGWRKGGYGSVYDGFCLDGALRFAAHGTTFPCDYTPVYVEARRAVTRQLPQPLVGAGYTLWYWNDHLATDQADVLALLDRTIVAEQAK